MNTQTSIKPQRPQSSFFSAASAFSAVSLFIGLMLLCCHTAAFAAEKSIGVVITGDLRYYRDIHESFVSRLGREGHGEKTKIIVQTPYPDNISISNAIRKLIAINVDVIVTYGAPAAIAAYNEKSRIPVVYADVYEPVASRLRAASVTGIGSKPPISSLLRYLKSICSVKNLGIIYSSAEEDSACQAREIYKLSDQHGFRAEAINIKNPRGVRAALSNRKFDAVIVTHSGIASLAYADIEDYIRTYKVPTASLLPGKNYVITLYSNPREVGEKSAEKVIKILNGVPPERIGRTNSNDTELILNLKEVVTMGLDIPVGLVTEATKLIK